MDAKLYTITMNAEKGENYKENLPFSYEPGAEHIIDLFKLLRPNTIFKQETINITFFRDCTPAELGKQQLKEITK